MATLYFPVARIEGHARIVVDIIQGKVKSARFLAMEFRGFEQFVCGMNAGEMPVIVPRICGVCSTAHHIAAIKALEDAYGVTPPPLAEKIRHLLLLGQLIQNQATSLFFFTLPDILQKTSIFQGDAVQGEIAKRAMAVRKIGTELIGLAGGQFIHPIKAVVGGISTPVDPEAAKEMLEKIQEALPIACELFDHYWDLARNIGERAMDWGLEEPCYYMAAVDPADPTRSVETVRMQSLNGDEKFEFPASAYNEHLVFEELADSYAGKTSCNGLPIRANSLARVNMTQTMGTEIADRYLEQFDKEFGRPAHHILLFDLCRGIELINGLERATELLHNDLQNGDLTTDFSIQDGTGYGMVEAPRGPLIHHYEIENGLIKKARFVIPTVHNNFAIEQALTSVAKKYVKDGMIEMELEDALGWVVRAFDPCIACATH